MLFNSAQFMFVFLPIVWAVFYVLSQRSPSLTTLWLVAASMAFYAWWDYRYLALLLASATFNYLCAQALKQERTTDGVFGRRAILAFAVIVNLAALGYFKYMNFFISTLQGAGLNLQTVNLILPLGISFFTFTQIALLVDIYEKPTRSLRMVDYFLFVSYFPHLIAGPILHHDEMMPQFERLRSREPRFGLIAQGLTIFALGLGKKMLVADPLATIATPMFSAASAGPISFEEAWIGALSYTFQLYFDFSGYCDMAIGLSLLFGVKIPINFNSPYKSQSIIEFWRRWHITLSRFLRDYLYIPLGGNRRGAARRWVNLAATMTLGGLWHGAAWTFILWGILHGAYLGVNHAWRATTLARRLEPKDWWAFVSLVGTFLAVVIAWVLFRADSIGTARRVYEAMIGGGRGFVVPDYVVESAPFVSRWVAVAASHGLPVSIGALPAHQILDGVLWIVPLFAMVWLLPNTQELFGPETVAIPPNETPAWSWRPLTLKWRPNLGWAAGATIVIVINVLMLNRASEFLYYQF